MNNELFKKLIESLSLTNIQPLKIEFERKGIFPTENSEINIGWKISYPNESFKIAITLCSPISVTSFPI